MNYMASKNRKSKIVKSNDSGSADRLAGQSHRPGAVCRGSAGSAEYRLRRDAAEPVLARENSAASIPRDALKMPGVLGIVDREHLDGVNPRLKLAPHEHLKITDDQDFVAIDKVRFDGDLVAVIVAEDLRSAERALGKNSRRV